MVDVFGIRNLKIILVFEDLVQVVCSLIDRLEILILEIRIFVCRIF